MFDFEVLAYVFGGITALFAVFCLAISPNLFFKWEEKRLAITIASFLSSACFLLSWLNKPEPEKELLFFMLVLSLTGIFFWRHRER